MKPFVGDNLIHPEGKSKKGVGAESGTWPEDMPGECFYAEWDTEAPMTRVGQAIFVMIYTWGIK